MGDGGGWDGEEEESDEGLSEGSYPHFVWRVGGWVNVGCVRNIVIGEEYTNRF